MTKDSKHNFVHCNLYIHYIPYRRKRIVLIFLFNFYTFIRCRNFDADVFVRRTVERKITSAACRFKIKKKSAVLSGPSIEVRFATYLRHVSRCAWHCQQRLVYAQGVLIGAKIVHGKIVLSTVKR